MTRLALVIAALSLVPISARAQGNTGRDQALAIVMIGTGAPGLAFDILIIQNLLSDDGVVRKGFGINAIIFGSIAVGTGALMAAILLQDLGTKGWGPASVGLGAIGAGTVVLGVWGITHSRPPENPYRPPDDSDRPPPPPPPGDPSFSPPPPPPLPSSVQLFPQFGLTPHGGVVLGLAGTL